MSLVVAVALGAPLSGCGDDPPPAKPPAAKPKPKPKPKPPPAPTKEKAEAEEEEGDGEYKRPDFPEQERRDPFVFEPPTVLDDKPKLTRELEPLEEYGLANLKLTAIITGTAVPRAMFTGPDGFGHLAKEGDRIGRNGGRISDIRNNEVEITLDNTKSVGSDEELETGAQGLEDSGSEEPSKVIILLSNTDIPLPSDDKAEQDEEESIIDDITDGKIQKTDGPE